MYSYYINKKNEGHLEHFNSQKEITQDFVKKLAEISGCTIIPEARIEEPGKYSPWVVQAAFKNIPGQVMLRALDSEGFYISTGSACSARKNNRPILDAMHITPQISETAVRFSFGPLTTKTAVDDLFDKVSEIAGRFNN